MIVREDGFKELGKDEYVVFENGRKEGTAEARYPLKAQAFYTILKDENNEIIRLYSNDVRKKSSKGKEKFQPSQESCKVEIEPAYETEKAYALYDGTNGMISKQNMKVYYKFIAKSICYVDENGKIFAPAWAI